jgi:hypothetical protein
MSFKFQPKLFLLESRWNPSSIGDEIYGLPRITTEDLPPSPPAESAPSETPTVPPVEAPVPPPDDVPPPIGNETAGEDLPPQAPTEGGTDTPIVITPDEPLPPINPDDVPPPIGSEGDAPFDGSGMEPDGDEQPPAPPSEGGTDGPADVLPPDNGGGHKPDDVPPPIG